MNLNLQGSSHDKQIWNQLERALMFDLQWEKAKVYIYWHSLIASFSVLVIKNTMKIIMIFWVQMLLLALINISRLHWSGKRTQVHQQMMQPALLNLSNIYRQHFYLGCWSLVNPWKKASDRKEGKGTKLSYLHTPHYARCFSDSC